MQPPPVCLYWCALYSQATSALITFCLRVFYKIQPLTPSDISDTVHRGVWFHLWLSKASSFPCLHSFCLTLLKCVYVCVCDFFLNTGKSCAWEGITFITRTISLRGFLFRNLLTPLTHRERVLDSPQDIWALLSGWQHAEPAVFHSAWQHSHPPGLAPSDPWWLPQPSPAEDSRADFTNIQNKLSWVVCCSCGDYGGAVDLLTSDM